MSLVFSRYVHEPLGECVYLGDAPWYAMRKQCITILYHAIENTEVKTLLNFGGNKITVHYGKVGYNTVEYVTVFLHSDWLCFLWHGIKLMIVVHYILYSSTTLNS